MLRVVQKSIFKKDAGICKTGLRYKRLSTKRISEAIKTQNAKQQSDGFIFGLKPVDHTIVPVVRMAPPPPPPKSAVQNFLFPFTAAVSLGIFGYFYMNNKNDAYDYWEAMQTGGSLPGTFDDDDDDDDDDDFEDE